MLKTYFIFLTAIVLLGTTSLHIMRGLNFSLLLRGSIIACRHVFGSESGILTERCVTLRGLDFLCS